MIGVLTSFEELGNEHFVCSIILHSTCTIMMHCIKHHSLLFSENYSVVNFMLKFESYLQQVSGFLLIVAITK